ncbi:MAG TPA: hypothetical protein VJU13_00900 [Candidatus Nitrosocosmicus sp.]|nr:hypothetical protein [Candidatus Nitrosocosmicus sp.]
MIRNQENTFQQPMSKKDQSGHNVLFKYFIKCDSCSWSTSFYEASGQIQIDAARLYCPVCFKRKVRWWKDPF